jgi:hypothetical protein
VRRSLNGSEAVARGCALAAAMALPVGFGRILGSGTEAPILLVNLV